MQNFQNIRSMLEPYNRHRAILQGMYIRDIVTIELFVRQILMETFKFNFGFIKYTQSTHIVNLIQKNLTEEKIYIIYLEVHENISLHFINNKVGSKQVYIYMPNDTEQHIFDIMYEEIGYSVRPIPDIILRQQDVPLSYMYCLHFFLYLFISNEEPDAINKYINTCDDLFVMSFTKNMLKLCSEYRLINSHDYYILTNNTYQVQRLGQIKVKHGILKVSSISMFNILKNHIHLNIASFLAMVRGFNDSKTKRDLSNLLYQMTSIIDELNIDLKAELIYICKIWSLLYDEITANHLKHFEDLYTNLSPKNIHFEDISYEKNPLLIEAIQSKNDSVINVILESEPPIIYLDHIYELSHALEFNKINVVRYLLNNNADINYQTSDGMTALMVLASKEPDDEILNMIMNANNIDVNIRDKNGKTALHYAINKNKKVIRAILENKGFDRNILKEILVDETISADIRDMLTSQPGGNKHYQKYLKYKDKYLKYKCANK